jgi:hypothetical protein
MKILHQNTIRNMVCLLLFLAGSGCGSAIKLSNYSQEPGAKLSDYKTFDFYEVKTEGDVPSTYQLRAKQIQTSMTKYMEDLGLKRTATNPDMLINLGLHITEKVQTREKDIRTDRGVQYVGQRNYSWQAGEVVVGYYHEGALTIDMVDRAKQKMMWQFVLEGIMSEKSEPSESNIKKGAELMSDKLKAR